MNSDQLFLNLNKLKGKFFEKFRALMKFIYFLKFFIEWTNDKVCLEIFLDNTFHCELKN